MTPASPEPTPDIHCDGNLHWCASPDVAVPKNYLDRIRNHPVSIANKRAYLPGWASKAVVGDPKFVKFDRDAAVQCDFRIGKESPAMHGGIMLPDELQDPLRPKDNSAPDIGAIPYGQRLFSAGRVRASKQDTSR